MLSPPPCFFDWHRSNKTSTDPAPSRGGAPCLSHTHSVSQSLSQSPKNLASFSISYHGSYRTIPSGASASNAGTNDRYRVAVVARSRRNRQAAKPAEAGRHAEEAAAHRHLLCPYPGSAMAHTLANGIGLTLLPFALIQWAMQLSAARHYMAESLSVP